MIDTPAPTAKDIQLLAMRLWRRVKIAESESRFGDAEDMRSAALALDPNWRDWAEMEEK